MSKLFISDLHLDASRPDATATFIRFLQQDASGSDALYILGDLFEFWIDDSDPNPHHRTIIESLAELTSGGTPCYIMHGNRDFMLGPQFARETGTTLLFDPTLIYVGGQSVLLSHGDHLCTDDEGYQRYRRIVRNPTVQRAYNKLPWALKLWIARKIRGSSSSNYGRKRPEILDVNPQAVRSELRRYQVSTLLHGHTHRPAIHEIDLDGKPATRIVLGDWYDQGSVLRWDNAGPRLTALDFKTE